MTEGKRNIIRGLLQEHDIETAEDIQDALKDLLSGTLKEMMETEMDEHLGYDRYERSDEPNYRNGTKQKRVRGKYGEFEVDVPQDRQSSFEPKILLKRKKDISAVYPIVFIDAAHFSVRDDGVIRKLAACVVLGINEDGKKEVLSIEVGENESGKYWLSVLNSLKNRGVKDILILCSDGPKGIGEAIAAAFPETEQQRCIVHMVRNTLKYVANKDMKAFAKDLKAIYAASDEKAAFKQLENTMEKWEGQYPSAMTRWKENWDAVSPIFKFSEEARRAFCTTNAIESLNSSCRRLNRQRSVFPSSQALLKVLYLATFEIVGKWTVPIRNWGKIRGELAVMYPDRMPE